MHRCFFGLMIATLLYNIHATPYFKPWLERRQGPTLRTPADLIYPPNENAATCLCDSVNLFDGGVLQNKRKRSLHHSFHVPQAKPLYSRQQVSTCTAVAFFSFRDWEGEDYQCNTQTILLQGGHTYTFSLAANVDISMIRCWRPKGRNWEKIGEIQPKDVMNATLVTQIKDTVQVHWEIFWRFGHPSGDIAVFSDASPPTGAPPANITKPSVT